MQPVIQSFLGRLLVDKLSYRLQFVFTAALESARIVENIAIMVLEDEFVANIMLASL